MSRIAASGGRHDIGTGGGFGLVAGEDGGFTYVLRDAADDVFALTTSAGGVPTGAATLLSSGVSHDFALGLADGTVLGFDATRTETFGDFYHRLDLSETASALSGEARPVEAIYDFWLETVYAHTLRSAPVANDSIEIIGQAFIGFDNLTYGTAFLYATDVFDAPGFDFSFNSLIYTPRGQGGSPEDLMLDWSAVTSGALFALPLDRAGVIWVDEAGADGFTLALAVIDHSGNRLRQFDTQITRSGIEGMPALDGFGTIKAAQMADGSTIAALEIDGGVYLGHFGAGLRPDGSLIRVDADGALTGLLALPGGGFIVVTATETSAGDANLFLHAYDEDFATIDTVRVLAEGGIPSWLDISPTEDGRLILSWTDNTGGGTHNRVFNLAGNSEVGGNGTDDMIGTTGADHLAGGAGNDEIHGRGGNDSLMGGDGNDILAGGWGADRIDGGAGTDTVLFERGTHLYLGTPARNSGEAAGDLYIGIERFRGSAEGDRLSGGDAADIFEGRGGDDVLSGGRGDDILIGNTGSDILRGGAGADQFRFDRPTDGGDTIADFASGADHIAIRAGGFGISEILLVSGAAPVAAGGGPQFLFRTEDGILSFDADGEGAGGAVTIATLTGVHALSIGDFQLLA